ncbi:hypothetical protein TMU01_09450 [Tenuibacillus multivorans]|nr:hypothetical protein TMU01_09450 [Tenuibacillus multivorans]
MTHTKLRVPPEIIGLKQSHITIIMTPMTEGKENYNVRTLVQAFKFISYYIESGEEYKA